MRQVLQAMWWWLRVAILLVVGLYALLSLWNNAGKPITVWYWFGREEPTSAAALAVASFLAGGLLCSTAIALFTAMIRYRRTRALRREQLIEQQREELARKAAMLRTKPPPKPIVKLPPRAPEPVPEPIVMDVRPEPKVEAKVAARPESKPVITPVPATQTTVPVVPVVVPASQSPAAKDSGQDLARDVKDEPVHVEATRATPFASTPSIAPGAKTPEPVEIIDAPKNP